MKKLKRILAAVMVFALCLTLFPSMVLAAAAMPYSQLRLNRRDLLLTIKS